MPKLTASKEEVQGLPVMAEGLVTVRLDGFKPTLSSKKDSVNLNPQMKVINHPEYNDRLVFDSLNTKAKWTWTDFCHAFGLPLAADAQGNVEFPGDFNGPEDNPEKWEYVGPLLGQQAQLYLIQSEYNGKQNNKIKMYVCRIQGCSEKHSNNLAK